MLCVVKQLNTNLFRPIPHSAGEPLPSNPHSLHRTARVSSLRPPAERSRSDLIFSNVSVLNVAFAVTTPGDDGKGKIGKIQQFLALPPPPGDERTFTSKAAIVTTCYPSTRAFGMSRVFLLDIPKHAEHAASLHVSQSPSLPIPVCNPLCVTGPGNDLGLQ